MNGIVPAMLLVLMYHRVFNDNDSANSFVRHLTSIAQKYPIIVPGDNIPPNKLAVCLTFDDAYYDFYHVVYPQLKALNIKAVLAVAPKFILDRTDVAAETRLAVPQEKVTKPKVYESLAPYCTWAELQEMIASGHVVVASHSLSHANLIAPETDLSKEVFDSKQILEKRLGQTIETFIYPYGKSNADVRNMVQNYYTYNMRIGGALNFSWHNKTGYTYRVDANHFWPEEKLPSVFDLTKLWLKTVNNTLRNK